MNFNANLNYISPSASMKAGLNIVNTEFTNFAIGAPDIPIPDELIEIIQRSSNALKYPYTASTGSVLARNNIANILTSTKCKITANNVMLCEGAKYGIYLTLKTICNRGDKVLILEPYWLSYPQINNSLDLKTIVYSPLINEMGVLLYDFNGLVRTAIEEKVSAVIINNPNNPSGQIIEAEVIDFISKRLEEAGIWLIIDEVYKELIFDNFKLESVSLEASNIIRIGSFSKSLCAPGLRLGYILSKPENVEKLLIISQHIQTCVNSLALAVAESICKETVIQHSLYCSSIYKSRYLTIKSCFEKTGIKMLQCNSSFYAFADFSFYFKNGVDACDFLLKKYNILCTPGKEYGKTFNSYLRICLTLPENIILEKFNQVINENF